MANTTTLSHPTHNGKLSLTVDASNMVVGAVLEQLHDGKWIPISYFSKKLTPTQTRYSTFDRELLVVFLSMQHFKYAMEGHELVIYTSFTDHKPLTTTLISKSQKSPPTTNKTS